MKSVLIAAFAAALSLPVPAQAMDTAERIAWCQDLHDMATWTMEARQYSGLHLHEAYERVAHNMRAEGVDDFTFDTVMTLIGYAWAEPRMTTHAARAEIIKDFASTVAGGCLSTLYEEDQ